MSVSKWSGQEEHLLKLLIPTHTYSEIETEFAKRSSRNLVGFSTPRSAEAIRKKCDRDNITPDSYKDYDSVNNPVKTNLDAIQAIQETYRLESITRNRGRIPEDKIVRKILSLSDIHFPLARVDYLAQAIQEHADADIVVLNGDLMEGYIFSTFEKNQRIAALDEYNTAFNFVQLLSEMFPLVVLVEGNHDDRAARALKTLGLEKEASQILRPNLLARIANGERLDQTGLVIEKLDFSNVIFQPVESWYVKIGKTLFIHPSSKGSSHPGFTVNNWHRKFAERYDAGEYDSIVCGHTHAWYKGIQNSVLLVEQGCLADLLSYAWDKKVAYHGNGQNGYAVIYQDAEGNTDFNLSGPIFLGEILPPKKQII